MPPVSCLCLTYGRPQVLEEAVQSFLLQDYSGPKELVVLNDFAEQTLVFDHPQVRVVNVPARFNSVGEKRNACAALASYDLLCVWDDDDLYLPHRLSFSVRMLDEARGFFKPSKAFVLSHGRLSGPTGNLFHSGSCFTRELFNRAHGYPHIGSGQDLELELAFERLIGPGKNYDAIRPHDIYYIYRWGGTGSYHLSGFGRDRAGGRSGNDRVGEYVQRQIDEGRIPTGRVALEPQWRLDYAEMVRSYLGTLASDQSGDV
ncbi:MAG: glycosyltransferase family 2 protein [Planctomycetes bacterium]|nr:glycosyltransferase family 2 protein [Planctomycetota bacterium]